MGGWPPGATGGPAQVRCHLPQLTALADAPERRDAFLRDHRAALREACPAGAHGTPFPIRRIFDRVRRAAHSRKTIALTDHGHAAALLVSPQVTEGGA